MPPIPTESPISVCGPPNPLADLNAVSKRMCRKGAILLAILFFLFNVPALPSLSQWRTDERFYTDAAVGMAQSGDYLTPVHPDGALRFKKPIVPYWSVLLGLKLFGFNYFGARIGFLIAGALTVWLCFEICQTLTRRSHEALMATAILASNLTMHNTSIRSTPDMLLCVFVLASLWGFINLIFGNKRAGWFALAYLGSGFAVATKGLSGLLPVAYAFVFVAVSRSRVRIRDLLHPVFVPAGIIIGGAWFVWAFTHYGSVAPAALFRDQVGKRFSGTKIYILNNAVVYLGSFIVQLLPWSLLALVAIAARRRMVMELFREHRAALAFAGGWVLFLFLIFVGGNIQRTRYFLPGFPFLALLYSFPILAACTGAKANSVPDRLRNAFFATALVAGILLAVLGTHISPKLGIAGLLLACAAGTLGWRAARWSPVQRIVSVAVYIVLTFSVNLLFIVPVFQFTAAPAITRSVSDRVANTKKELPMAVQDVAEPSQIRLLSAGNLDAFIIEPEECESALNTNAFVVCTEDALQKWHPANVTIERCGTGSVPWKLRDYVALCRARDRKAFLKSKEVRCYLVSKKGQAARFN